MIPLFYYVIVIHSILSLLLFLKDIQIFSELSLGSDEKAEKRKEDLRKIFPRLILRRAFQGPNIAKINSIFASSCNLYGSSMCCNKKQNGARNLVPRLYEFHR